MNSSLILSIVTFVYALATVLYISSWIFNKSLLGKIGTASTLAGIIGNIAGFILRWVESYQQGIGHAPLSNLYESLVFFSLTTAIIYIVIERRTREITISVFASPLPFIAMAYASLSPNMNDRIQPLIPALKSNWLIAHVITCFLGYAGFAVACGLSIMYLSKQYMNSSEGMGARIPSYDMIDELTYQMIMFGFLFLSVGIITGSVWANSAWGSYWSWDPKETWSLITWFVYALLLHTRLMKGWQGKRIAYISIIGFAAVLFTYFGVNYLPGLHSYGQ
ncbi:MAG: c-type cytochrome biogenesis protein CcsB [Proteobacteria bacterium]|nr:c-type cytochrome biogenesis protein CcsB [Pseudomonadota bacterium]